MMYMTRTNIIGTACLIAYAIVAALTVVRGPGVAWLEPRGAIIRTVAAVVLLAVVVRAMGPEHPAFAFESSRLVSGVPLAGVTLLLFNLVATLLAMYEPFRRFTYIVDAPAAFVLPLLVVAPLFEEIAVVGFVMEAAARKPVVAIAASACARTLLHVSEGPVAAASVLVAGVLYAALYRRWRSAWPLVVAHVLANLIGFAF